MQEIPPLIVETSLVSSEQPIYVPFDKYKFGSKLPTFALLGVNTPAVSYSELSLPLSLLLALSEKSFGGSPFLLMKFPLLSKTYSPLTVFTTLSPFSFTSEFLTPADESPLFAEAFDTSRDEVLL